MNKIAKAITAALVAGAGAYQIASMTDSPAGGSVTSGEWVNVIVLLVVAGLAVWAVPNEPPGV